MTSSLGTSNVMDWTGLELKCSQINVGGTVLDLDDIVAVTGAQTIAGAKTFSDDPIIGAGATINLDSHTKTLTTNAVTATKYASVVTSEALTTAAGSSQAFVITLTGVAAGDIAMVQAAGGTNTREHFVYKAITTTNTVTVTVCNIGPSLALNGTLIFNLWVLKA